MSVAFSHSFFVLASQHHTCDQEKPLRSDLLSSYRTDTNVRMTIYGVLLQLEIMFSTTSTIETFKSHDTRGQGISRLKLSGSLLVNHSILDLDPYHQA